MLPDSNSNEPGSHGYIQYRIKHTVGNLPGTQIKTQHISISILMRASCN